MNSHRFFCNSWSFQQVCGMKPWGGGGQLEICAKTLHPFKTFEFLIFSLYLLLIFQLRNGCITQIVNMKVFQLYRTEFFMSFHTTVTVTEFGTGNNRTLWATWGYTQLTGEKFIELSILTKQRSFIVKHSQVEYGCQQVNLKVAFEKDFPHNM